MLDDFLYLQYVKDKLKAKYNYFDDDPNVFIKTNETIKNIIATKNYDFLNFCEFFFFLYDEEIKSNRTEDNILSRKSISAINIDLKNTILKFLENNGENLLDEKIDYLVSYFKKDIHVYSKVLISVYKELTDKISSEKRLIFGFQYEKEILSQTENLSFSPKLNEIAIIINQINILEELIYQLKVLVEDQKRNKFNFFLSLFLAITSIIISIIAIFISK